MVTPKAPNHQKLILPKKNDPKAHPGYKDDARAAEMWANEGIVRSLHAGTGITLDPTDGVDQGQGITINSSGGGGTTMGLFELITGPDSTDFNTTHPFGIVLNALSEPSSGVQLQSTWITPSNASGGTQEYTLTASWLWNIFAGDSASLLPQLTAPTYTGGPCTAFFTIYALAFDFLDQAIYQTLSINIPSATTVQPTAAQFSVALTPPSGGDLTLTAGTGQSGNGLVSAAGDVYFGATSIKLHVPNGVTFT